MKFNRFLVHMHFYIWATESGFVWFMDSIPLNLTNNNRISNTFDSFHSGIEFQVP